MAREGVRTTAVVTFRAEPDIIDWYREKAEERGVKYQTLLKRALHEYMVIHGEGEALEERIRKIVREEIQDFFGSLQQQRD